MQDVKKFLSLAYSTDSSHLLHSFSQPYGGVSYASPQGTAVASQLQPVGPMYPSPFQGMFKKKLQKCTEKSTHPCGVSRSSADTNQCLS